MACPFRCKLNICALKHLGLTEVRHQDRGAAALLISLPLLPCPQMAIMNRNKMILGSSGLITWADVQEVTPGSRPDRQWWQTVVSREHPLSLSLNIYIVDG